MELPVVFRPLAGVIEVECRVEGCTVRTAHPWAPAVRTGPPVTVPDSRPVVRDHFGVDLDFFGLNPRLLRHIAYPHPSSLDRLFEGRCLQHHRDDAPGVANRPSAR